MNNILLQTQLPAGWLLTIFTFILGVSLTYVIAQIIKKAKAKTFQEDLQRQIDGAKKEAENIIK